MLQNNNKYVQKTICYHCGEVCNNNALCFDEKYFCCNGCKSVFEILNQKDLCTYYTLNPHPGVGQKQKFRSDRFSFLDDEEIKRKLIQYTNGVQTQLTLYLPQIHCSSCLWLLENVYNLNEGINVSRVNFTKKEILIGFDERKTTLRKIVETLTNIGYEPYLSLNEISNKSIKKTDKSQKIKIGIAGFCFANIMMLSLADYFAGSNSIEPKITIFFQTISLILSLPVLFYAASEIFVSAWKGIKNKYLNIDLPVAIALLITFFRSIYEIINGFGNGYLDSMSGIVFFLLIGRWFQSKTYQTIAFDRDYKSFFPIALNVVKDNKIIPTEIENVKEHDVIQVYSKEIVPVDAILSKGKARIDYSFVSGESLPVTINIGEMIYAGGKQMDGIIELLVVKTVAQSYLTDLWNNPIFNKKEEIDINIYDYIAKYFTLTVLILGFVAGIYWYTKGENTLMWNAITTVLIVACPCALLLSKNYTYGNILRIFGLNKFYLRSPIVIEALAKINHLVFDKTGTITQNKGNNIEYYGEVLSELQKEMVASLLHQSSHPASKIVVESLNNISLKEVLNFKEKEGEGIEGWLENTHVKIGSPNFAGGEILKEKAGTKVVVSMDNKIMGEFIISNIYRQGLNRLIAILKRNFPISLLSGDNDTELKNIEKLLGKDSEILFCQTPQQKLEYIEHLQMNNGKSVMMIGDGLNDAGALKQSNVGIVVSDSGNNFTPASDGVIDATKLSQLNAYIQFAKAGRKIIFLSFAISILYNVIGLYYAIQGILSPVVAAILMPASSITIVFFTYGLSELFARKYGLNNKN